MKSKLILYWSRRDFRLSDNPALHNAVKYSSESRLPLLPIFILENYMLRAEPNYQFGYPSRYFISEALPTFAKNFEKFYLTHGTTGEVFESLAKDFDIEIFVNEDIYIDFYKQVKNLQSKNFKINIYKDQMTVSKDTVSGAGKKYSVFTPFKNAVWSEFINEKVAPKVNTKDINFVSDSDFSKLKNKIEIKNEIIWNKFSHNRKLEINVGNKKQIIDLSELTDKPDLSEWLYNEEKVKEYFEAYIKNKYLDNYKSARDSLERDTEENTFDRVKIHGHTSKMSPALAWGLISARTLKNMILEHYDFKFENPFSTRHEGATHYIAELIWREFYKYIMYHNPNLMHMEFQERFRNKIDWVEDGEAVKRFKAWIQGETGYPIVDASMKQLAQTGWMHNRSRMIVASILSKNLGVDWRWGQEYFRATLIDLDEASNNGGWQWGASVGADPKPIRIFNPDLQSKNYDASDAYKNKWLASDAILKKEIHPIVEHKLAREQALIRYGLQNTEPRDY